MKMAMKDGQILIKDADNTQFTIIKSWSKMKWSRAERMFYGPAEIELLNKLAGIVRLPGPIEAERQRLNQIAQAVDAERMKTDPEPLYKYPVKFPLFKHQTRAANMALITFGLVPPPEDKEGGHGSIKQ
ncbi:MAG: hypothetical protein K1W25_05770 [Lachnospiraceae bacterium]